VSGFNLTPTQFVEASGNGFAYRDFGKPQGAAQGGVNS
jgi:hypothetical protein